MEKINEYVIKDFIYWSQFYLGTFRSPNAFNATLKWAKEHHEERELRTEIFSAIVRSSQTINDEFLSTTFEKSGLTNGHYCVCHYLNPISANVISVMISTGETWHPKKGKNDFPEAFKIQKMVKDYGIAMTSNCDTSEGLSAGYYYDFLTSMMGLKPEMGADRDRKICLMDRHLGVEVVILSADHVYPLPHNDADDGDNVVVKFLVAGEKLGKVIQLISRDDQQEILNLRNELIDEFIDEFLGFRK